MATVLIVVFGSRGDLEPLLSLSRALLANSSFSHIHLSLPPLLLSHIPAHPDITAHKLPPVQPNPLSIGNSTPATDIIVFQRRLLANLLLTNVVPALPALYDLVRRITPRLVIATTLVSTAAATLAEAVGAHLALLNFQPNTPTAAYPSYMNSMSDALRAGDICAATPTPRSGKPNLSQAFLNTYHVAEEEIHARSLNSLNAFRKSCGLQEYSLDAVRAIHRATWPHVTVLNSYSAALAPAPPDWSDCVHLLPPLATEYLPEQWAPDHACPSVLQYLAAGPKPLCVTFGSMSAGVRRAAVTTRVLNALRASGVKRVVLLQGQAGLDLQDIPREQDELRAWAREHVLVTQEAPQYAWLFPRCAAVLCHGGAGTLAAALLAGVPVAVAPVLCDQFFWGTVIREMRFGDAVEGGLRDGTVEQFTKVVSTVLAEDTKERVRLFAQRERQTLRDGSQEAASILERVVGGSPRG